MAMTYTSLTAAKGTSGAIATWVNYTKLDIPVIVDEAQLLIYSTLRAREMRADYAFSLPVGYAQLALPAGFLDPIGRIKFTSINTGARHKDQAFIQANRAYSESSGTLNTNPFTTVNGSNTVTVYLANHGFSQNSLFNTAGATAFNGVTIAGTFPINGIVDANNFTIDITALGTTPNASSSGGGSSVTYICDSLVQGLPLWFGIWNELIYFDQATSQQLLGYLQYYKSQTLLSANNQSNFLCTRYPQLLRTACVTAAADFMKDDAEYQKGYARLTALIQQINIENDGSMRGMELDPDIP